MSNDAIMKLCKLVKESDTLNKVIWRCEFCESLNKNKFIKCESCGAPRPKNLV